MLSLNQGSELVSLARKSISYYSASGSLLSEIPSDSAFKEKQGCFVSLHSFPKNELRGCVGFPLPVMTLWQACIQASVSAAFEDSRFASLKVSELSKILIEVSVLSKPCVLSCPKEELPEKIKVGKHGLIISKGFNSGLLLPQVALEWNWNSTEFLEQCCLKAGLPSESWKSPACKVEGFEAQVFKELSPAGKVVEEKFC